MSKQLPLSVTPTFTFKYILQAVLLGSFILGSFAAYCQEKHLFQGTIGKDTIIMELFADDSTCTASYFFVHNRKDVYLEGSNRQGNIIVFDTTYHYEFLHLYPTTSGFEGKWINRRDTFPVKLIHTDFSNFSSTYDHLPWMKEIKEHNTFQYLKVAGLQFISDSISQNGTVRLDWYTEIHSGIMMPRVVAGFEPQAMRKVNDVLLESHLSHSDNYLSCLTVAKYPDAYTLYIDHLYASADIFSINLISSYYCGGSHPDFDGEALNFDTRNGELLHLDSVYRFDKSTIAFEEMSTEWFNYRSDVFAPAVVKLLQTHHLPEMQSGDCDYNDPEVWDFPNWYFTESGIYFGARFITAERACSFPEWSVIPYKAMRPYLVMKHPIRSLQ